MKKLLVVIIAIIICALGFYLIKQSRNIEPQNIEPQNIKEIVTLYFANNEYIMTGNEEIPKLIAEKRTIEYKAGSRETVILNQLLKGPTDPKGVSIFPASLKIISVAVDGEIANVNFSSEGLNGGSLQEAMIISQITKTLIGTNGIQKVRFLIDGKKSESLMGHIDISEPLGIVE